jgi:hypothetical protein
MSDKSRKNKIYEETGDPRYQANPWNDKPDRIQMILEEIADIKRILFQMFSGRSDIEYCDGFTPDDQGD